MSVEIYVLSDNRLADIADWQAAITMTGYDLILSSAVAIDSHSGFLPAAFRGQETGFECDRDDAAEIIAGYPQIDFGRPWKHLLAFRWGGDITEGLAGYLAASAYAKATDGVIFDPQDGTILSPEEGFASAIEMERFLEA